MCSSHLPLAAQAATHSSLRQWRPIMADSIYDSDEEVPVVSPATAPKPTAPAAEADGAPRRKSMNGKSLGRVSTRAAC